MKFLMGMFLLCVFAINIDLTTSKLIREKSLRVSIPGQGSILGSFDKTAWTNQTFYSFRGVPYAESPSGSLRFKPPRSRTPWFRTIDARNYGRSCPVISASLALKAAEQKEDLEDCLTLNIFTKSLKANQPVMIYIYGGGFANATAPSYPPHFLMEKDIVLVVPQYRIGVFGWLTTLTSDMPGNVPVMDLQFALSWVQKYIRIFGGDPKKVTIFGQSAGGAMSGALLLSPKTSESYFHRTIVQSSSVLVPWAVYRTPLEQAKRCCEALGCKRCNTARNQYACLRDADVLQLLNASQGEGFGLAIGDVNGVLPDEPKTLLQTFNRSIPIMTGFTKQDGSFLVALIYQTVVEQYGSISNLTVRQFVNLMIDTWADIHNTALTNNLLLRTYIKPELLDTNNHTALWPAYIEISNVVNIKSGVIANANALLRRGLKSIYLYSFEYVGENTRFGYGTDTSEIPFNGGVHHSNDLLYLLDTFSLNETDTEFAKKMVNLWYSFAVDGVPQIADQPELMIKPMETESGLTFI